MLKHIPQSKDVLLPEMKDDNILDLFEEFIKSPNCPSSVNISLERVKNRTEMRKKGYTEPIAEGIVSMFGLTR